MLISSCISAVLTATRPAPGPALIGPAAAVAALSYDAAEQTDSDWSAGIVFSNWSTRASASAWLLLASLATMGKGLHLFLCTSSLAGGSLYSI